MRKILNILTPENVFIEYELAGLGSRFAALIVDLIIQLFIFIAAVLTLYFAGFPYGDVIAELKFNIIAFAVTLLILFHLIYYTFFEMIMKGQSPGKKLLGIRVIRQSGEPEGIFDSLLRNSLRIVYVFPFLYLLDAFFVIMTKNYKRIGDYAANTVVVKVREKDELCRVEDLLGYEMSDDYMESSNTYPVNQLEYEVLKGFLARKNNVGNRRYVFAYNLNKYFSKKFNVQNKYNNPYEFFEEIVRKNSGLY